MQSMLIMNNWKSIIFILNKIKMNVKYNELYQYITNNKGKALDDCDVFDVLKYDNFNYFFIANSSKIKFTRDKEEIKYCSELINESFENEVNNYPIITNKIIPVINIYFDKKTKQNKVAITNTNSFYIQGIIKVPDSYFRVNPGINNYTKLIYKISEGNFESYTVEEFLSKNIFNFTRVITETTFNNDIMFNNWIGLSNQTQDTIKYSDIYWTILDTKNIIKNVILYQAANTQLKYNTNVKNIQSLLPMWKCINDYSNGVPNNNFTVVAHKYYMPYTFNLSKINGYDFVNFIYNQYDYGIYCTEYIPMNLKERWNVLRNKYLNTFGYPKTIRTKNIKQSFVDENDPVWPTVVNKAGYLRTMCKKIGYKWRTKDKGYYVCCDHTAKLINKEDISNMIYRENGEEVCKYCGEILGNYNDEKVFDDGMDTLEDEVVVKYKWNEKVTDKQAKESWTYYLNLINAFAPEFANNNNNINKFIEIVHSKNKIIDKFRDTGLDIKALNKTFHDYVLKIKENPGNTTVELKNFVRTLTNNDLMFEYFYNKLEKYWKMYWIAYMKKKTQFDYAKVIAFCNDIPRKSKKFIDLLYTIYIVSTITGRNEYSFFDIDWNVLFGAKNYDKYCFIMITELLCLFVYPSDNNQNESNLMVVDFINKFFEELGSDISVTYVRKIIDTKAFNNTLLKEQQELINTSDLEQSVILDAYMCPEIITREFSGKTLHELTHAKFQTHKEYFDDKYKHNICNYFNTFDKFKQYNYMDVVNDINNNYIEPLRNIFTGNFDKDVPGIPNLSSYYAYIKDLEKRTVIPEKIKEAIESTCPKNIVYYRDLVKSVTININDIESLYELYLSASEQSENVNYTEKYNKINNNNDDSQKIKTFKIICETLIKCYLLCTFTENVNIYNILNTCITNFYMYLITTGIPYTFIKNYKIENIDDLIKKFVDEFFNYNRVDIKHLMYLFDELQKHTQLFISPDYYIDSNIKTKRLIKKINNDAEREIELKEMDIEEKGPLQFVDTDKLDYLNLPTVELETLTQNELIGGEVEDDLVIDEDVY